MMITQEVIRKAQQGDSEAFTRIYNETIKTAYYVAKRILLDEQAVEDVLQESYIAVYEHLEDFKTGNFQGWVDTIVANRSKNYLRKKNPILFSQMETEDNTNIEFEEEKIEFRPDEKVDYEETKRLVMKIVDGLSPDQRLATILFYFEQRSVKEIAEICECSENTVKSRLNYARKKIKEDVLELEKKGTKLYSINVLPFLYWLFKEELKVCKVPASTSSTVATATGKAISRIAGKASSLSNTGTKVTETVAKTIVEETAKTGMALGTKVAIGVAVATISIGGVAFGGTLLKDYMSPTEQESEYDTQRDTETEDESEQETEQLPELTKEEIDQIVNEFLVSYQPAETMEIYGFSYVPVDHPYARLYSYNWCNDIPIVSILIAYEEVNGQAESIGVYTFYYVDTVTGEIIEIQSPMCLENIEYGYEFYVGEADILIEKSFHGEDPKSYYLETVSSDGFDEDTISAEEGVSFMNSEDYRIMEWDYLASLTANTSVDQAKIAEFLESYVPDSTYDVYELKGYPPTTYAYKESVGVRYVSFMAAECDVLVIRTPYGKADVEASVYYKLEVYYYDEAAETYVLFENQPDITHDVDGYPTNYNFDVYAANDGFSNEFTLASGASRIIVTIKGTTLENWNIQIMNGSSQSGTPLEWKNIF